MSAKSWPARRAPENRRCCRWLAAAAALLSTWGLSGPAAACDLVLAQVPEPVRIAYNPFAPDGAAPAALDLLFQNRSDAVCDLRLALTDAAGLEVGQLTLAGVEVEFRARESSGLVEAPTQRGVFHLSVAGGSTGRAQLNAVVLNDAVAEAGVHEVELTLLVRDAAGRSLLAPVPLRVALVSTPRAQLSLAGAAGAFGSGSSVEVVDFGEAATGATRRIFVQLRANAPSSLIISSLHRGVLKRVEPLEGAPSLAYRLEVDGQVVDLATRWSRPVDPPRDKSGLSLPMIFTLGEVRGPAAGRYEDVLTIDISPD